MVAACPFPANRGTPSRILDMSRNLANLGHEVHVVTYHFGSGPDPSDIFVHRTPFLPYRRLEPGPTLLKLTLLDPLLFFRLLRVVRKYDIDLIHAHHFEGALIAFAVRRLTGVPVIYDAHTTLDGELSYYKVPFFRSIARFFDKRVPALADHVVAVSDTIAEFLRSINISAEKIDIIPTGVTPEDFTGLSPEPIRQRYRLGDRLLIMYTGTLAPFQGIEYLLAAMRGVAKKNDHVLLVLVGNTYLEQYKAEAIRLELTDRVLFTGERPFSEIPSFLSAADICVIPRAECPGIPQKLTNYMAAGKAIVSFAGSAELLSDGEDGLVVANGDTTAMAEAILRLLDNADLRRKLGDQARASLLGRYDWPTLCRRLEPIYARVLDNGNEPEWEAVKD